MTDQKRRIMGRLICLDGDVRAEAIGAKLRAAGFEFKVTDDVDEESDDTRFVMVWLDIPSNEPEEHDWARFMDTVKPLVRFYEQPDEVGIVAPNHVPAKFGDYGDYGIARTLEWSTKQLETSGKFVLDAWNAPLPVALA